MSYTKPRAYERIPEIRNRAGDLKGSFKGKCLALRTGLFPEPPKANPFNWLQYQPSDKWDWPELSKRELEYACLTQIKGKTPRPDAITQEIITHAYRASPEVFNQVFAMLLKYGYHPVGWRTATRAILGKGKKDTADPKSYRIISLLSCLGKVLERIIAKRLGYLAETSNLLDPSQIRGRLKKSAIDATLLLTNKVQENRRVGRKTSVLFLDIKSAFNHVADEQLLAIMARIGLPVNLLSWVRSFMRNRTLRCSFNGEIEDVSPIETGIPQGSPVSPILFLIYLRELFPKTRITYLSYIDNIALIASSGSYKRNKRLLEEEVGKLFKRGKENHIEFDLRKTELINFSSKKKDSEAQQTTIQLPDRNIVKPGQLVRWLGVFFDPGLTFKDHVSIRISQARSAF